MGLALGGLQNAVSQGDVLADLVGQALSINDLTTTGTASGVSGISASTVQAKLGGFSSSTAALWLSPQAPSNLNYAIFQTGPLSLNAIAGNGINFQSGGVTRATMDSAGGFSPAFGSGSTALLAGGNLNLQSTPVSNSGVAETDLFTYSLPANTLTTTNRGIRVTCYGSNTGSATTKTLKFYFGTAIQTVVLPVTNAGDWELVATIVRTSLNNQRFAVRLAEENDATSVIASWTVTQGTAAQTETAGITIKVTGQDSVGSNTVTANLWSVDAI